MTSFATVQSSVLKLIRLGQMPRAESMAERWLRITKDNHYRPLLLAPILGAQGRFAEAVALYDELLANRLPTPEEAHNRNQSRKRISKRRVQFAWREWQRRAGFDRLYAFHCIRHSSITNVYRVTRDLFLAQRFARHVSPLTTTVYTHPSDEEMRDRLRGLGC